MNVKINRRIFLISLLYTALIFFSCGKSTVDPIPDPPEEVIEQEDDGVIRILAIGNSFSEDALENYLYELAKEADVQIVIGNLYVGGASLQQHWQNTAVNNTAYQYRKIDQEGRKTTQQRTAMNMALVDEYWDYVSFQQASPNSGQYSTYEAHLPLLFDYVKQRVRNPEVKYILHQTWAYAEDSNHSGFPSYGSDQLTMYHAIMDAVSRAKELVDISLVVPAGTAIQNGRTSTVGDNFTRDGYHLHLGIGRFTAACTWFEALTGESVKTNAFRPTAVTECEAEIAKHAAHLAIQNPYEITDLSDFSCTSSTD